MSIDADAEQKGVDFGYEDKTPETPNEGQTAEEPTDEDVTESGGDKEAESAEEEGGEQEGTALINFLKEHFGEDLSHYGNDYEALKALINARKLVGKREEDAILAKRLRERFGDDYIEKLLFRRRTATATGKPRRNPKAVAASDGRHRRMERRLA